MKKEHWDESEIENLLKQSPKVTDNRSKEEVFQRLLDEGAFSEQSPQPQKKVVKPKGIRWTPLIASIASLFLIVVFARQFIGSSNNVAQDQASEALTESSLKMADSAAKNERLALPEEASSFSLDESLAAHTLVYESQLQGVTLFTIGLSGDNAESVPVSFLIPNEIVNEKLGTTAPTKLQLYEAFAPLIDEEGRGFREFHPFKGKFLEKDGELVHQLPKDHPYDTSLGALSNYTGTLIDTFSDDYEQVYLENMDGASIDLDYVGEVKEPISLRSSSEKYNYYAYQMSTGAVYLSPNFRMSYSTVEEALQNMTTEANDIYRTVILPNVTYTVKSDKNVVTVKFDNELDLQQFDAIEVMRMIEGILMTAAQFDRQVKFEQIVQEEWNGFNFTGPLDKPIAANIFYY
ncbi:MAG: hypothetical protein ABS944_02230 [Solibacillus sp.]|uniref:hypothetical protein n=1 Tax=Solibacillus sp. TaxID=1909654 RepID=UPI003315305A